MLRVQSSSRLAVLRLTILARSAFLGWAVALEWSYLLWWKGFGFLSIGSAEPRPTAWAASFVGLEPIP
jgi:hypothetical protein